jgi:hypothetical protein
MTTQQQLKRRIEANLKRFDEVRMMTAQEEKARLKVIHSNMRAYFRAVDGLAKKSKAKSRAKRK